MHLIQLMLPLYDNAGVPLDAQLFRDVRQVLLERFGGVTAFTRAPAQGLWQDGSTVQRDDVLLYEVMAESLDREWWAAYRRELEDRFRQQELVVRAQPIERL
jgi:hypothetical protein